MNIHKLPESSHEARPVKRQKLSHERSPSHTVTSTKPQEIQHQVAASYNYFEPLQAVKLTPVIRTLPQAEREAQVGILHFVNDVNPGFTGILKKRYTDFIVNEIAVDGTVLHLTDDGLSKLKITQTRRTPTSKSHTSNSSSDRQPQSSTSDTTKAIASATSTPPADQTHSSQPRNNTTMAAPAIKSQQQQAQPTGLAPTKTPIQPVTFTLSPEDDALLVTHFSRNVVDKIVQLHQNILASAPGTRSASFGFVLTEPIVDKEKRITIHNDVRRIFCSRLETSFQSPTKVIKVTAATTPSRQQTTQKASKAKHRNTENELHGKLGWDQMGGEYLHFYVCKENRDTMEVIKQLARSIKCKPEDITFAGTKDRRAVTTQAASIFRQRAETVANANITLINAKVGNFVHKKVSLELGELAGNLFTITLRECELAGIDRNDHLAMLETANKLIKQAIASLNETGFINYFGLQRFGTHAVGTETVGKLILQNKFKEAIYLGILELKSMDVAAPAFYEKFLNQVIEVGSINSSVSEDDKRRYQAIFAFLKKEYRTALELLPRRFVAEAAVMRHLSHSPSDYIGAILAIPRNLRTMYVHAYQSLVWNYVASERWARYGAKVIEGDLIIIKKSGAGSNGPELDMAGEPIVRPGAFDQSVTHDDIFDRARPLTRGEAESGKYSILEIVLPTPGFDIEYPGNDIGDFYKEFMATERGGGLDPASMRRQYKDFSLSGSYRSFLATVGSYSLECHLYEDENEQFAQTDIERMMSKKSSDTVAVAIASKNTVATPRRAESSSDTPKKHIRRASPDIRWTPQEGLVDFETGSRREITPPISETNSLTSASQALAGFEETSTAASPLKNVAGEQKSRSVSPTMTLQGSIHNPRNKIGSPQLKDTQTVRNSKIENVPQPKPVQQKLNSRHNRRNTPEPMDQDTAQKMLAWTMLPTTIATDDKAKVAEAEEKHRLVMEGLRQPTVIMDTFRETGGHGNGGKRTGISQTQVHGEESTETKVDVHVHVNASESIAAEIDVIPPTTTATGDTSTEHPLVPQRINTLPADIAISTESLQREQSTPKLAVVAQFSLASSTYATMALREISHGGIQAYQPDQSNKTLPA